LTRVSADDPFIRSRGGLNESDHFKLTVQDNGPGISGDRAARIFEPFYTTKTGGKGSGIGLAVVQNIVLGHGGEISVESEPGRGATFSVYLPCAGEADSAPASPSAPSLKTETDNSRGNVLLIDDDESIVKLGEKILCRAGFEVASHTRGESALDAFRASPDAFDLIITDMMMPDIKGDDLARAIHSKRPTMPIILVSGFSGKVTGENCRDYGFSQLIEKPMEPAQLVEAARRVLADQIP
jgi:CheY-like chemotaxis protein